MTLWPIALSILVHGVLMFLGFWTLSGAIEAAAEKDAEVHAEGYAQIAEAIERFHDEGEEG